MITYEPEIQEVADDMIRLGYGDKKIENYLEGARRLCAEKGLPYYEIFSSKFFNGRVKYLLKEFEGEMLISDLDTGQEWRVK